MGGHPQRFLDKNSMENRPYFKNGNTRIKKKTDKTKLIRKIFDGGIRFSRVPRTGSRPPEHLPHVPSRSNHLRYRHRYWGRNHAGGVVSPPRAGHRSHFLLAQGSILTLGKLLEYMETRHLALLSSAWLVPPHLTESRQMELSPS